MSERKAINKYYPPDWDPSKVPKKKKNLNPNAEKVRLMVPFSMKCLQCSEYISARRKFNARKEITDEKYMGIKIIKFHIKCPRCNHSLSFQTDPKSAGFIPVSGCARNYESMTVTETIKPLETAEEVLERLEKQEIADQQFQEQQQRRKNNPFWSRQTSDTSKDAMSNLEDKLIEQKREQEIHDHLLYLQAKSSKLQQAGGEDQLVSRAQMKLRSELKRERDSEGEDGDGFKFSPEQKRRDIAQKPLQATSVPKKITVKKTNLLKSGSGARDTNHVIKDESATKILAKSQNLPSFPKKSSVATAPVPFMEYESSEDGE